MMSTKTYIPEHYAPLLNLYDTQKAIGLLKRVFEDTLCGSLHLRRVSAPLFVEASSGLNDDLNGVERPVLIVQALPGSIRTASASSPTPSAPLRPSRPNTLAAEEANRASRLGLHPRRVTA